MLYDLWERYRTRILLAGVAVFLLGSFYFYQPDEMEVDLPLETPAYALEKESEVEPSESENPAAAVERVADVYVDVKGSVKHPGLYRFSANERIFDAIAKAGGALPEADLNQVNLAQPLIDGSAVRIPKKGEPLSGSPCPCSGPSTPASGPSAHGKVNINMASLQDLMTLPGIGESRAQTIIAYRTKNGPFRSPDDLKHVSGIGDKMYERLKDRIAVR